MLCKCRAHTSYDYERGANSVIPLYWSQRRTLTIGDRRGSYPETPATIQFNIVWVSTGRSSRSEPDINPDRTVACTGRAISVQEP